jgi:hypothetical protein
MAVLLIVVILAGCATLTPDAEKVRVTQNPEATKGCTFIKTISVVNTWGPGDSEKKLRLEAVKVGANLVFQGSGKYAVGGHSFVHYGGEAYRCGQ